MQQRCWAVSICGNNKEGQSIRSKQEQIAGAGLPFLPLKPAPAAI
jgi:hypothetical protein